jgi:AraC-like DNA-binding protein
LRRYLKETGRPSLADLLRDRRLENAMQRLLVTDEPVERIAEHCGFIDYTTFFRAFRKRYGMSPTDQRREAARKRTLAG